MKKKLQRVCSIRNETIYYDVPALRKDKMAKFLEIECFTRLVSNKTMICNFNYMRVTTKVTKTEINF